MEEQSQTCGYPITESELLNKSSEIDGLTNEPSETFWEEIKIPLCNSITKSNHNGELITSQKQAVIKLIVKRIRTRTN